MCVNLRFLLFSGKIWISINTRTFIIILLHSLTDFDCILLLLTLFINTYVPFHMNLSWRKIIIQAISVKVWNCNWLWTLFMYFIRHRLNLLQSDLRKYMLCDKDLQTVRRLFKFNLTKNFQRLRKYKPGCNPIGNMRV